MVRRDPCLSWAGSVGKSFAKTLIEHRGYPKVPSQTLRNQHLAMTVICEVAGSPGAIGPSPLSCSAVPGTTPASLGRAFRISAAYYAPRNILH